MNIKEVLENLGYDLRDRGAYYSSRAKYRDGQNENSLAIYKDSHVIVDFVTGEKLNLESLVARTLNLPTKIAAREWLDKNNVRLEPLIQEPKLSEPKTFPAEWITNLIPDHSYWLNRGISREVLEQFKGGVASDKTPRMKGRYVFPVFDSKKNLVGMAGRILLHANNSAKWKLVGEKKCWKYPLFVNHKFISEEKRVILVESIGNCLALWEAGYKNTIVMFGVDISWELINYLLRFDVYNIVISTDNDGKTGEEAANKIYRKLGKYFDKKWIKIIHPIKKDFGEQSLVENVEWIREYIK